MRKLLWLAAFGFLFAAPSGFCQTSNKDGWGLWRYTDFKVSGIEFRSKCISDSGADSKWAYQFRSRHDRSVDFVERQEHGVPDMPENELDVPEMFTLDGGARSPIFQTKIHGTCAELYEQKHELKIEIECVIRHDDPIANSPCFKDADGAQVEFKRVPSNPRYK